MKNTLLITTDQQHVMTLGVNNKEIHTPNLDKLVKMGVNFERSYCPNPTCTPSRASIITGQYPSQHKAWTLGTKLDESIPTIGDLLISNNIKTALIGKAHFQQLFNDELGKYKSLESYPLLQDLDFWRGYDDIFYGFEYIQLLRNHTNESHVGQHYALWLEEKIGDKWKDYYLETTGNVNLEEYLSEKTTPNKQFPQGRTWDIPLEVHYNEFITSKTIAQIEKYNNEGDDFFVWASYPDPHPDYLVPEPYASMYNPENISIPETYYQEESDPLKLLKKTREDKPDYSDYKETGNSIHGCKSHIQDEESLKKDIALYYGMVTYIDDEVGKIIDKLEELEILNDTLIIFTTDHGHYYGQHKLVRKGPFMYEDAIKIPFIVAGGNYKYNNLNNKELVSLIDIYPTIAEHHNLEYDEYNIAGKSILSILENKHKINFRDGVVCEFRHEPYKLNLRTYITKEYKITVIANEDKGEIYDLTKDKNEMVNLWSDKELRSRLLLEMVQSEMNRELLGMPRVCNA